jgi:hypothetical protein
MELLHKKTKKLKIKIWTLYLRTIPYDTYKFFDIAWMLDSNYGVRRVAWNPKVYLVASQCPEKKIVRQDGTPYSFTVDAMQADDWVIIPHRWTFNDIVRLRMLGRFRRMVWGTDVRFVEIHEDRLCNQSGDDATLDVSDYAADDWICIEGQYLQYNIPKRDTIENDTIRFRDAVNCVLLGGIAYISTWEMNRYIVLSADGSTILTQDYEPYVCTVADISSTEWTVEAS